MGVLVKRSPAISFQRNSFTTSHTALTFAAKKAASGASQHKVSTPNIPRNQHRDRIVSGLTVRKSANPASAVRDCIGTASGSALTRGLRLAFDRRDFGATRRTAGAVGRRVMDCFLAIIVGWCQHTLSQFPFLDDQDDGRTRPPDGT